MKNAKKNWLSRLFKSFSNSSKKSGYKPQPLRMEILEERAMLNVAPILTLDSTVYNIPSGSPWYIPLTSTDADGDEVYYKVEVLSGNLTCDLSVGTEWQSGMTTAQRQAYFNTRNPYWELTVSQEGNAILNGEDSKMLFELFADKTPITVNNILTLTNSDYNLPNGGTEKFYNHTIFHRVVEGFMSQGGAVDIYGNDRGSTVSSIPDEFDNDLQMTSTGVLAMANAGADTGTCQFFITSESCNWLNFKHTVFGFLIDGQEVQAEINKQGTDANSTPDPDVVITNAQQVVNYTNSTLTIRANENPNNISIATISVTPYDEHGLAGESQTITVLVQDNNYLFVPQGENYTQNFQPFFNGNQRLGYSSKLYYIKSSETGQRTFEVITNGVSTNYDTGEVTVNCANFPMGDYYLEVSAYKYNSTHTIKNSDLVGNINIPIIIGPESDSIPAPTSISLVLSDDTGIIGDGYTSVNTGTTFTVEGADSQYETEIYVGGQYYIGTGIAEEGATSVDIASKEYNSTTQTYSPAYFGYGSYNIVAVNVWYCPYYNGSGWSWASIYSDPSPVFELHTVLDTPENLTASDITSTAFTLNWSAVDNADCYYIAIRIKGSEKWDGGLVYEPSYTFTNMDPNTTFEVQVYAYIYDNYASLSLPTEIIEVQTLEPDPSEILPSPEDLTASNIDSTGFNLSWSEVDGANCYYFEFRKKGSEEWIGNFLEDTFCSLNNLDSSSVYEIRVSAYNSNNKASMSAPSEIEVQTLTVLNAPSDVWAEISDKTVSVSWDAVQNAALYNVFYRELGTEQWHAGKKNVAALSCQFDLPEEENAKFYEVAVRALPSDPNRYEASDGAVALTNTGDMPLMTATLTTWNGRNNSVIPVSVNEWEFLNLQLLANSDDVVDQGGVSIVFQYDATLVKPDWKNSEFADISYSYHDVPLDDLGTTREVTFIAAILDTSTVIDGLVANIKMASAKPDNLIEQVGVSVTDESRDLTITVFTDRDKTASEANVINTTVWAVPYDLNDSGSIDVQDFISFAMYYGCVPDPAVKNTMYYCDFDLSGTIEVNDFILFATYYGLSYAKNGAGIAIKAQSNADAVNAQGAAPVAEPVAAPAQSVESNQATVTTILVEPIHDCVLTPVSSSNAMASAIYYTDVIQASNASNTLANQEEQETDSDFADNYKSVYIDEVNASLSNENNALNPDNVDLFFDLELFNDDENSDWEDELGGELLPNLPNRNSFTD